MKVRRKGLMSTKEATFWGEVSFTVNMDDDGEIV